MIYLAILLILCGLLIVITALSIETGIVTGAGYSGSDVINKPVQSGSVFSEPDEVEIIFPGDMIDDRAESMDKEDIFISFDDDYDGLSDFETLPEKYESVNRNTDYKLSHQQSRTVPDERRKINSDGRPDIIEKREKTAPVQKHDDGIISAVMFDDRSNIIDYESGVGAIDSTFSKYKSIKRIGKGKIETDYDGINFYLDEKLYRFDFHKVYDIWSGSNYVALPLKGNSTVKLFIIENPAGFPEKVEANFKEYEKGL
jgi:hypothetical protein